MTIEIVHVTQEDQLKQCLNIRRKVFIEEQGVEEALEIDELDTLSANAFHVLILYRGQPAATGRLRAYKEDAAKLQRIAVMHEYRGLGLGKQTVAALERKAKQSGFKQAILDSQCHAEPFYAGMGYKTISDKPFLDAGIEHVRMTKGL